MPAHLAAGFALVLDAAPSAAQSSSCPEGPLEMLSGELRIIQGDCDINGNIKVGSDSLLAVSNATLTVHGNIDLIENATLAVHDSTLVMDNQFNMHRSISGSGRSTFRLRNSVVETSIDLRKNFFMGYFGRDDSVWMVDNSSLDSTKSWLMARLTQRAQLFTAAADHLPTEIVVLDQAKARIGSGSSTSVWLTFREDTRGTLHLPDQSAGSYSFSFGRNSPGAKGIGYQIDIIESQVRLHLQSHPSSRVIVFGQNKSLPGSGELTVGYYVYGNFGAQTVSGLRPGYEVHRRLTHQERLLELFNVKLTPIGWSVYVLNNDGPVIVTDSTINELSASNGGVVEVRDSILQLAVLASLGGSSSVNVRNSHIFSQAIHARGNGRLEVIDSFVHGSLLEAKEKSLIQISGSLLLPNGDGDTCNLINAVNDRGMPRCNPFRRNGALPAVHTTENGRVIIVPTTALTADLQVSATQDPGPVLVGDTFVYSAQAMNAGPDDASDVRVLFRTPPQAAIKSFSADCMALDADAVCSVGDLPSGAASVEFSVTYEASGPPGVVTGNILISGRAADPDLSNNMVDLSTTIEDPSADLQVVGSAGPNPVTVGAAFQFAAEVGNAGPGEARGVQLLFETPPNAIVVQFSTGCSRSGDDVLCEAGDLPVHSGSAQFSVTYEAVGPAGAATGGVSILWNGSDPEPANNAISLSIDVLAGPSPFASDLQVVGSAAPDSVSSGESFSYVAEVTNSGPDDASGVTVLFQTPPNALIRSFSAGCAKSGSDIFCDVGNLALGSSSAELSVLYEASGPVGPVSGVVSAYGNQKDPDLSNNARTFTTSIGPPLSSSVTDLVLVGSAGPTTVTAGSFFMYGVEVGNAGPDEATGVTLLFQGPPNATITSFSTGCSLAGADVACNLGTLAQSTGSALLSVVYEATSPAVPATGVVSVSGNETDPNLSNNVLTFTTAVDPKPSPFTTDLQLLGSAGPETVVVGSTFVYGVQVGNAGPDQATGVTLIFNNPPNATVSSLPGECSALGDKAICTVGSLAPGAGSPVLQVTYVALGPPGQIAGTVSVSGNETDPDSISNQLMFTTNVAANTFRMGREPRPARERGWSPRRQRR